MREWIEVTNEQNDSAEVDLTGFTPTVLVARNDSGTDVSAFVALSRTISG